MSKYLTEHERYQIEQWLKDKYSVKDIAAMLHKSISCIYHEIKKGLTQLLGSDLVPYEVYLADVAQMRHQLSCQNKGVKSCIHNNHALLTYISDMLVGQKLSPYAVSVLLQDTDFEFKPCERTIYNYIYAGLIPNVSIHNLAYKRKRKQRKIKRIPFSNPSGKTMIEKRCAAADQRLEVGHWEMDTVYSGKEQGKNCLLVLTERVTRREIIIKMPDRTAASTISALDKLERRLGKKTFASMFRSITCDNGSEFSDISGITKGNRTILYHCHAYSSWERGTNENQNKLIRRFIRKGESIAGYTKKQIKNIEDWINTLPRKLFGGYSANEMFREACISIGVDFEKF